MSHILTEQDRYKIHYLYQAIYALEKAKENVERALGVCDVTSDYNKEFSILILELEDDITDVREPAE